MNWLIKYLGVIVAAIIGYFLFKKKLKQTDDDEVDEE